ncbi:hypothetical protein ACA910_011151 [Epithemia clementina (nom. ined.)]
MKNMTKIGKMMKLTGPFLSPGPLPPYNHCGYQVAVLMVVASLGRRKIHRYPPSMGYHSQVPLGFSNQVQAAQISNGIPTVVLADNNGRNYTRVGYNPCGSLWFHCFNEGCKRRMGQEWRPDQAITSDLVIEMLEELQGTIGSEPNKDIKFGLVLAGCYFALCYVHSLLGPENLLIDVGELQMFFESNTLSHTVVPLWGQVKGEHCERYQYLPTVNNTDLGIPIQLWLERGARISKALHRTSGPLMLNQDGSSIQTSKLNKILHEHLGKIYSRRPDLFPQQSITQENNVYEKYSVFRSFR